MSFADLWHDFLAVFGKREPRAFNTITQVAMPSPPKWNPAPGAINFIPHGMTYEEFRERHMPKRTREFLDMMSSENLKLLQDRLRED